MIVCNAKILNFYQSEDRNDRSTLIWACKEIVKLMGDLKESGNIGQQQQQKCVSNCLILIVDLLLLREGQGDNYLLRKEDTICIFDKEAYLKTLRKEFKV